jgi:hypothetical protein
MIKEVSELHILEIPLTSFFRGESVAKLTISVKLKSKIEK